MAYAIANVIYGFPIVEYFVNDSPEDLDPEDEQFYIDILQKLHNCEDGFLQYYSGGADITPSAFGVNISRFDECENHDISSLVLTPTKAQIDEFNKNWENLAPDIKEYFQDDEPRAFILWSSS